MVGLAANTDTPQERHRRAKRVLSTARSAKLGAGLHANSAGHLKRLIVNPVLFIIRQDLCCQIRHLHKLVFLAQGSEFRQHAFKVVITSKLAQGIQG